ncbi:hypothetical protein QTP88_012342 [Uroleucon formosanum]
MLPSTAVVDISINSVTTTPVASPHPLRGRQNKAIIIVGLVFSPDPGVSGVGCAFSVVISRKARSSTAHQGNSDTCVAAAATNAPEVVSTTATISCTDLIVRRIFYVLKAAATVLFEHLNVPYPRYAYIHKYPNKIAR